MFQLTFTESSLSRCQHQRFESIYIPVTKIPYDLRGCGAICKREKHAENQLLKIIYWPISSVLLQACYKPFMFIYTFWVDTSYADTRYFFRRSACN